jgi:beta-mannosidase
MAVTRIMGSGGARPLDGSWAIAAMAPDSAQKPSDLDGLAIEWIPCDGPMPAAAALRAAGRWQVEHSRDFDAEDWWYRCRFMRTDPGPQLRLRFQGLATIADVWLNGTHILHSTSMFTAHAVDVGHLVGENNELVIRFHALRPLLAVRRPRPTWRTALVAHQQLRFFRTTMLGRMATWRPSVAPVGPWRPILLEPASHLLVKGADVRAEIDGDLGVLRVAIEARLPSAMRAGGVLSVGELSDRVSCEQLPHGTVSLAARVRVPHVERWWPHTHGPQPMYPVRLSINVGTDVVQMDLGRVGFRTVDVERGPDGNGFGLAVNGVAVFCRGVCWTPLDLARLGADSADYRTALELLRDAGMNMVRVPGTTVYEADEFHELCDELGILVWQDFMFANMDYPHEDEAFARAAALEARQRLESLQGRPSLAVCCGNNEVEQQAAMMGVPRGQWTSPLFANELAGLVTSLAPGAAWLPSTPTGGAFPFQPNHGVSHYYGVGAYRRPLEDARRAGVRFAAECLAFSNVPDASGLRMPGNGDGTPHPNESTPGVPRDAGADWDFEHVRDHYVKELFGVDPVALRAHDAERYYALGRVAIGEVMLRTFAEWRRPGSSCRGGLVWFARDFSPGAGWGIIDSCGRPKSAYWYLRRALAPVALLAVDEGLNGLWLHAINDTPDQIEADLLVAPYRDGCPVGAPESRRLTIPPQGACSVHADELFNEFRDMTNAYRFDRSGYDVIAATLRHHTNGELLASAHSFPVGLPPARENRLRLVARGTPRRDGYALVIEADRFAHAVAVDAEGFEPDDNYLHLEPRQPRTLFLRSRGPRRTLCGTVAALNGKGLVPIVCEEASGDD